MVFVGLVLVAAAVVSFAGLVNAGPGDDTTVYIVCICIDAVSGVGLGVAIVLRRIALSSLLRVLAEGEGAEKAVAYDLLLRHGDLAAVETLRRRRR